MLTDRHHLHLTDRPVAHFLDEPGDGWLVPILESHPADSGVALCGLDDRQRILDGRAQRFLGQKVQSGLDDVVEDGCVRVVWRDKHHGIHESRSQELPVVDEHRFIADARCLLTHLT